MPFTPSRTKQIVLIQVKLPNPKIDNWRTGMCNNKTIFKLTRWKLRCQGERALTGRPKIATFFPYKTFKYIKEMNVRILIRTVTIFSHLFTTHNGHQLPQRAYFSKYCGTNILDNWLTLRSMQGTQEQSSWRHCQDL